MILLKLFFFFCSVVQWHPFIWTEHEKHETLEFTAFKNNLWKVYHVNERHVILWKFTNFPSPAFVLLLLDSLSL